MGKVQNKLNIIETDTKGNKAITNTKKYHGTTPKF